MEPRLYLFIALRCGHFLTAPQTVFPTSVSIFSSIDYRTI